MKDDDLKLLGVLLYDTRTDICDCRVAFATENYGWFGMIFENIQSDLPNEVRGQS